MKKNDIKRMKEQNVYLQISHARIHKNEHFTYLHIFLIALLTDRAGFSFILKCTTRQFASDRPATCCLTTPLQHIFLNYFCFGYMLHYHIFATYFLEFELFFLRKQMIFYFFFTKEPNFKQF